MGGISRKHRICIKSLQQVSTFRGKVNTLRGNRQQRPVVLKRVDGFTDDPKEVAEELAKVYCKRSATSSYPPSFQIAKAAAERRPIDFSYHNNNRNAVVIPIPKPNCRDSGPNASRPISLTSCMAKLLERINHRRLITEFESSGHGTDTYFAELERSLPTTGEHCLIASLDLSKAYDTTWRHGILRTLKSW
ncbi:uncharacterized protein LOC134210084 [Armigeres subalbatus]|uniref:uncharacterized protein LOC134210084 n=1 Tax=Armigeres subalbatus TaxID=124917 RepID=UPI002ED24CA7